MKISLKYRILISVLLGSLMVGFLSGYFYYKSPQHVVNIENFQRQYILKEVAASNTIKLIGNVLIKTSPDSLAKLNLSGKDISYYVLQDMQPVFWSDNQTDITGIDLCSADTTFFAKLSNTYVVVKSVGVGPYEIVALIRIKNNYPYENDFLQNNYVSDFNTDKRVEVSLNAADSNLQIHSADNQFLFSLIVPETPVYNALLGWVGFISFLIAAMLVLVLLGNINQFFRKKELSLSAFLAVAVVSGILLMLSLYFNFPQLLYWKQIFSALEYASNPLLASLSHLSLVSFYFFTLGYLFFFHTRIKTTTRKWISLALHTLFFVYFITIFNILVSLVFHSSIQISILRFNEFSFVSIWVHFLILIWGIALALVFFKIHNHYRSSGLIKTALLNDVLIAVAVIVMYFLYDPVHILYFAVSLIVLLLAFYTPYLFKKRRSVQQNLLVWVLVYSLFFIVNSYFFNNEKKFNKYKVLAENILINGNTENDRMADILLEDLDNRLTADKKIYELTATPDSLLVANEYLNETYFRGFWNKYDMRLNIAQSQSELDYQYDVFIERAGTKLKDTHFYSVPASYNDMSYLGIFPNLTAGGDTLYFYMEFYPRKNFRSYSFPNLLMNTAPDIQRNLKIKMARYEDSALVYSSEGLELPADNNWIPKLNVDFYSFVYHQQTFYAYQSDASNTIVITETEPQNLTDYLLYFIYTFLLYYVFVRIVVRIFLLVRKNMHFQVGLTSKYQYSFIALLIFSFLGIFYVSVNYIQNKYSDEQIAQLESKKKYIQKALQDMYYWNQDLRNVNTQNLNFDLQELSYVYQTDILVYDNNGVLIGSSQPLIFNKNLISRQISPNVYFATSTNINQSEYIGKLEYLTGYTDFYNGDYLQTGFIAVPQFLSQEEMRNEIQGFLAVIIHIYLIIIMLAVFLSVFIGRQISAPLKMIEDKLKQMRFGHRNEKIDYQLNDEIGQLVGQYNRMLDELEKSAQLLAKSEREQAWKTMARQIAHEINNPLTPMKLTIQQLQRTKSLGDERFDNYFEKSTLTLIEQIDNLSRIAGTFSNFARMPEAQFVKVDVAAKLHSVVQLFAHNHEQSVVFYEGVERGIFVMADPEQLTQVFNNLLKNAIQSIPTDRSGVVNVSMRADNSNVYIDIADNGSGIPDEISDKLFTPNFTTKTAGMGLGLTITKNIIEISGGSISFNTKLNEGTTFTVVLPLFV